MKHASIQIPELAIENLLLENIQGGIVYSDAAPPFHFRYVTEGLAEMSGYSQEELLQMKQMDIVVDDDAAFLEADVGRQLSQGDTFTVEYRLKRKDGTHVHVLDRAKRVLHDDGNQYIHCILTDITDIKRMEQAVRMNEEKYKFAIKQSGNVILEYDLIENLVSFSDNFYDVFGCEPPCDPLNDDWIIEESRSAVKDMFKNTIETKTTSTQEIIVKTTSDRQIWILLILSPVLLPNGDIAMLIGCMQDIDDRKRKMDELTVMSQVDGLTGVYNRVTMERMIASKVSNLSNVNKNALMLIDIDHFKDINDMHGHGVGDEVLISVAKALSKNMPFGSIFGRLGGDEFIAFANLENTQELTELCKRLNQAVKKSFQESKFIVTVSVGGAISNEGANTFHSLYRNADIALYKAKESGRDRYAVFQAE